MDYIYFLYGLSFVFLAVVCLAHGRRAPRGFASGWLTAFALLHGVNEWLDMIALSIQPAPPFDLVRLLFLTSSFLALFEFGRRHVVVQRNTRPGLWIYGPFLLLFGWGIWRHGTLDSGFIWARFLLGLPGGLLAAWGFATVAAGAEGRSRAAWRLATGAMFVYALLAGLIVAPYEGLPLFWPDRDAWLRGVGVPVPVFRMLAACLIAVGVWRAYELNWEEQMGRYISALNRYSVRGVAAIMILLIVTGLLVVNGLGHRRADLLKQDQLRLNAALAEALSPMEQERHIAQARLLGIGGVLFASMLLLGLYVIIRQKSEQRWAALLQLALRSGDLVIWDWHVPSGQIIYDEGYQKLLGYEQDEGKPHIDGWKMLLHPKDRGRVLCALDAVVQGASDEFKTEYRIRHKSGRWVVLLVRGSVIQYTGTGAPVRCIGTSMDITARRRAEERERESETTYRDLIDSVSEAVYVQDGEGRFLDVNAAAERMYGYERETFIGRTPEFLSAPGRNDLAKVAEKVATALGGEPQSFEFWGRRRDGTVFPKDVSLAPATYFGRPVVIAVGRDTTERKRWEHMREALYRLGAIAESATSLTAFCEDMQPVIDELLPTRNLLLALQDERTGLIHFPYFRDDQDPPPPPRPSAKGLTDYLLERGQALRWSAPGAQETVREAGYAPLGAMASDWIGIPLKKEGRPFGALIIQDYTGSVHYNDSDMDFMLRVGEKVASVALQFSAEQALRESEEKYRKLFTSMTSGFALCEVVHDDKEGPKDYRFIEVNAAFEQQTGMKGEKVVGRTMREVFPDVPARWIELGLQVALTGEALRREFEFPPLQKSFELVAYSPKQGQFAALFSDITDRKRIENERLEMERKLQHAQKLESLGIMAGGIAHDFNNLLMVILGNLELAGAEAPAGTRVRSGIDEAANAAQRAAELTRQMLDYTGKGIFKADEIDVNELIKSNAQLLKAVVSDNVTLDLHLQDKLPLIRADAGQVQQIIMNLITNAAEALESRTGDVTLSTGVRNCDATYLARSYVERRAEPGRFVWVEVADNGCGMEADTLTRLFDPFFSTKFTGRGLGLSAVLGIVGGHGGAILVDTVPGEGSTFRVLFPAVESPS